jgi:DNA helicase-2/ATP-dependent DNA helicase PcrA
MAAATPLASLNAAQQHAVTTTEGPVLVIAGPGSGKTRVLTQRIAYLVAECGIPEYSIAAVTFTNKAAREMQERVEKLMGRPLKGIMLGTFHAFCAQLLRQSIEYTPYRADFTIYDSSDQKSALREVVREHRKDLAGDAKSLNNAVNAYHALISHAKNELIIPDKVQYEERLHPDLEIIYRAYNQRLHKANALDFDDLLMQAVLMLEKNPQQLAKYQTRYQYLMVDEFQDTNTAQYRLIYLLSHPTPLQNVFVVGDPDQSIYAFRGADYRNVQRFRHDFPHHQLISLDENYRSHQLILNAAMSVIRENTDHIKRDLFSQRKTGPKITIQEHADGYEEARSVLSLVQQLRRTEGYRLRDCAIMYRTNAQSRELELACRESQLPYRIIGGFQFYERQEIKDLLAYLHIINNPNDVVRLERVINTPPRGIGDKSQQNFRQWSEQRGEGPWQALQALLRGEANPLGRSANRFAEFAEMLDQWLLLKQKPDLPLVELLDHIIEATEYQRHVESISKDKEELRTRRENIEELRFELMETDKSNLAEYLAYNALMTDNDRKDSAEDMVTLMTLHAAKGLEFSVVFITGVEDGRLPHERSRNNPEAIAEERRLFYVGITRAKERLYLSYATVRRYDLTDPSKFLYTLPETAVSWQKRYVAPINRSWEWQATKPTSSASPPPKRVSKFNIGDAVMHNLFGRGAVTKSILYEDMEEVTVQFDSGATKRLDAAVLTRAN